MDLNFTSEETAFRAEVRAFLRAALRDDLRRKVEDGRALSKDEVVGWQRILNARGWATPSWPKEWGGPGWTPVQRHIFMDELHQAPAPEPLSFNVAMLGPVLIAFGTEAQKQRFLPNIFNGQAWWCQGYSEPGAGSDLASVTTRAVLDGDHYVVNGQKTWTSLAQFADWGFFLVRTDPDARKPQEGISFLLIDMKSPGVTVRPIITIDGGHEVNDVFLDNVRVPLDQRIGEENKGWTYAKYLLSNERTGIARIGMAKRLIARAKALAADLSAAEAGRVLDKAAAIEAELKALEITQLRVLAAQKPGVADPRSSILKIRGVELRQAASELLLKAAGPRAFAFAYEDEPEAPLEAAANYFTLRAGSIYGGATEVQKNILATGVLGL
jgi:alkylation response protein AidB-like acyl-CoA dehydrogenase